MEISESTLHKALISNGTFSTNAEITYLNQPISYDQFILEFLLPNKPCLLGKWSTENWNSRNLWRKLNDEYAVPNFNYLVEQFGDCHVPVANCKTRQYNSQLKEEWVFKDYIKYWMKHIAKELPKDECYYLKDWHFTKAFPKFKAYATYDYFSSDWINEYWDHENKDDYRFVYMGPKNSWTPFHADVFKSFSWSSNICGKKKWIMLPPGEEVKLIDKLGNLPYDVGEKMKGSAARFLTVIQEEGETIFVPSGWHHQVYNLENTISINHNWVNFANISKMCEFINSELIDVKNEIQDCKDLMTDKEFITQCELILNANSGINLESFLQMLEIILEKRLKVIQSVIESKLSDKTATNIQINDLKTLKLVIENMVKNNKLEKFQINFINCNICHCILDIISICNVLNELSLNKDIILCGLQKNALHSLKNVYKVMTLLCNAL